VDPATDAPSSPAAPPAPGADEPPGPTRGGWGRVLVWGTIVVLAGVGLFVAFSLRDTGPSAKTVTYVVPDGTTAKAWKGEKVEIMPPVVNLNVGDTLVIRNLDSQTVTVGPFAVRAGETLTQRFNQPQTLIGECTLSGSGSIRIVVT
jgi:hypothetical protein